MCTTAMAVLMLAACLSDALPLLDVRTPQPPAQSADTRCPRDGVGLGAEGVDRGPVYLLLIDREQHASRPHLPADLCQEPRPEVLSALLDLKPASSTTYSFDLPTT